MGAVFFLHFQFATHSYACMLAMHLCGMEGLNDVPSSLDPKSKESEFIDKLSRRVVEFVFLEPENLKCVYRAAGETEMVATQTYCICQEGKCMPYYASSSQFVLNFTSPISRTPCKHLTAVVCRCSFWYFWYSVIVRHVLVRQIAVVLWSNAAATNAQCSGTIASALEARLLTSLTIGGAQTLVPNPEVTYIAFVNDQPLKILPWFNVS